MPPATSRDYLAVVESCYADEPDDSAWLNRFLEVATPSLGFGVGVGLTLFREREDGNATKVVLSGGTGVAQWGARASWPFMEALRGEAYRRLFYPRNPVTLASPVVATLPPLVRLGWRSLLNLTQANDVLGMLAYPAPGWSATMFAGVGKKHEITPKLRATLHRVRIHVEAGLRLRVCSHFMPPESEVAVLSPEGKVLHLNRELAAASNSDVLVQHAKSISRVRTKRERSQDDALNVWTALVEGRWSLVERVDSDGKRLYYAYENAPRAVAYRALTEAEATVLDQSIQGLPGKYVAYATGLRESRISEHLLNAAHKLGFRTRNELVQVAATLRATGNYKILAGDLTPAEAEVLRLVKMGMSNREIAKLRNTSLQTVANQVSSLLRKVGVAGRRGLAAVETAGAGAEEN